MSILNLIVKGGFLMYVLTVISVISIGIIIEKYRQFRKVRLANSKLQLSLKSQDKLENIRALINMHKSECLMGLMLDKLFNSESDDLDLINQSMEATANLELHRLEKGLGWLSTFAAIAPLIGFLGTVIGMVNVFMKIQAASQSGVDISMLAGGIWVALLTTVGGLIVGIATIIFYNDLVQKLENIVKDMQENAVEYIIKYKNLIQSKL
ncbi:MAG: MotA/TolQ/ExbB proton channel family protein [Candidatus Cloacimonas sp.]|jgi:biopolymer transport protein ExbB|nr:MotA/TolQ/ExbB proton channel family protein [Candidatus Cloacimonas sp.]HNQ39612.1 MotA/TolQ/ExbB proton channel family protein [Candidatus Cloacimonas sp.]HNS84385.1 MotA/TolQ/ExbB proton channel family protein [Candidatus Cloacimonas sp.]HPA24904.1 MotA/TolQ/ExbB proton channel family protein [Candidatus Cloacimonas sp.]HQM03139.1 MotA/TolQ/ExbB proton channel family protein [Candidatus Cloacimonas sp.]